MHPRVDAAYLSSDTQQRNYVSHCAAELSTRLIENANCDIIKKEDELLAASSMYHPVGAFKRQGELTQLGRGVVVIMN